MELNLQYPVKKNNIKIPFFSLNWSTGTVEKKKTILDNILHLYQCKKAYTPLGLPLNSFPKAVLKVHCVVLESSLKKNPIFLH